jgi:dienelactone hydrolase
MSVSSEISITSTQPLAGYPPERIERVSFGLPDGDTGIALVAYPDAIVRGLVVALHQTTNVGMREPMGLDGAADLAYGEVLRKAGYMVIAPEAFAAGERAPPEKRWSTTDFYSAHPKWSAMGKMLADNEAALTAGIGLYRQRFGAQPVCIAAIGHSLGAHNALFLGALDERIDVVISNGGFERMASDTDAIRWSRESPFNYMPALSKANRGQEALTWDWEDVLIQTYPRNLIIIQGMADEGFTHEDSVAQAARAVESAYAYGKYADRFTAHLWVGGHAFPKTFQDAAGNWIAEGCKRTG